MRDKEYAEWQQRANDGDGLFAIASALLDVAYQLRSLGNGDAASPMGAMEHMATTITAQLERIADAANGYVER